ncbi:hypothetical protein AB0870_06100 [Microbacterium proteolyticum]|uniref:hypothetical protein n=1 Tax=Microbacterium proteolyticum TaxID=1572644 RepID=UPI0024171CBE|nr:hypothetical protein [Microbacterium proteolyticum]
MRERKRWMLSGAVAVLLVPTGMLGACAGGGSTSGSVATAEATVDPSIDLPAPGTADTCILGTWSADLPNLAAQMEDDFFSDAQLPVLSADVTIDGETLWVFEADHTFSWGGPTTYTTYLADKDGTEFVVKVEMGGTVTGRWRYADPSDASIELFDVDTSRHSTTPIVTVNGTTLGDPSAFDAVIAAAPGPGAVEISCATGLLTRPAGSPFTTQWELVR